jgi:hypothetical protein
MDTAPSTPLHTDASSLVPLLSVAGEAEEFEGLGASLGLCTVVDAKGEGCDGRRAKRERKAIRMGFTVWAEGHDEMETCTLVHCTAFLV